MSDSQQDPVPAITPLGRQFVGRSREMDVLRAALAEAKNGRGQIAMLAGEPGIGKTRIAQELARHAESEGGRVLWGRCYEGEGAPPYWPWIEPVRAYILSTDAEKLRHQMGQGASIISGLFPEVTEILGELPAAPTLEPDQARFRLFDAITAFLKNAAVEQHLLFVLDDLHWADEPSLLLLEFLAQHISDSRLMILGAHRDAEVSPEHPLNRTLARLSRQEGFRRQLLEGLDEDDIGRFIAGETGFSPSPRLVSLVHAHTEGNPFFLAEVVQLLTERGDLIPDLAATDRLAIPQSVRDVIGQRLSRLSTGCNRVLNTAAVIGRGFDFSLLGVLDEDSNDNQLLGFVEEALMAKVVEEVPGEGDRYQFTHALVQQTLLENLSNARKVRLHARIGESLETMYGDKPENHAAELAHHFAEAAPVLGTGKLITYALMAGESALAAYADEEAVGHFAQGLKAKEISIEDDSPALDAETAALLFGIGRAQATIFRRGAAHNLTRAFDYYAEAGDAPKAVAVAAFPLAPGVGRQRITVLISRALELAPPDSLEAAGLLSRYGWALGQEVGDYDKALSSLNSALAIAQEKGDRFLEMSTRAYAAEVNFFSLRHQEVLNDGPRMRELAQQISNPQAEVAYRISALMAGSALDHSLEVDQLHIEKAEGIRNQSLLAGTLFINSAIAYTNGQMAVAKELTVRGLAEAPEYAPLLMTRTSLEYETGDAAQGGVYLERLLETVRHTRQGRSLEFAVVAQGVPLIAEITGNLEHLDAAATASESVLSYSNAAPFLAQLARSGLAVNMILTGNLLGIEKYYEALKAFQGIWLAWAGIDQVLGQICRATGRLDQALEHFEAALDRCRGSGHQTCLARLGIVYPGTLLDRGDDGDRELARALLDESMAVAEELGMGPLQEQLMRTRDRIPAARQGASYPGGLTQREADVIRLIAQGKTDREIAEELIISVRTVTTHVSNILNKTGAANRAEAASFATRQGLD